MSVSAPTLVIEVPPEPRRRRRWPWVLLIVLAAVLAVLVAGFFLADSLARSYAAGYVKQQLVRVLGVPESTPMEVTIGEGSLILQALTGSIGSVDVVADELRFGPLVADTRVEASGVPLDGDQPVERLQITLTITQENVQALASSLSGLELRSIELVDDVIRVGTEFNILNLVRVPVVVDLEPGVADGGLTFTPLTVYLSGREISVAQLKAMPQFALLAGDLLRTQTVCVADALPAALEVSSVRVAGAELVVGVNGDGVALGSPELSTPGSCG